MLWQSLPQWDAAVAAYYSQWNAPTVTLRQQRAKPKMAFPGQKSTGGRESAQRSTPPTEKSKS
jgi:hypothetical protein